MNKYGILFFMIWVLFNQKYKLKYDITRFLTKC